MADPQVRQIVWDIYEEHLDEAAWLWGEWESALDSPLYAIGDVAIGFEARLLAHLDGLVLGGQPVARKLLLPALGSEDANTVAAATFALIQAEDADHHDAVFAALGAGEPPIRRAIGRALSLCPRVDCSRLVPLALAGTPEVQATVMDILGPREPEWVRIRIEPALRGGQSSLVVAALRAIRRTRDRAFVDHVQAFLQSDQTEIVREATAAALVLGLTAAWSTCRAASNAKDPSCRFPVGILATSPDPNHRAAVRTKVRDADAGPHALWALGFAGDEESAGVAVQTMAIADRAKLAGEVFAFITGIDIAGPLAKPGEVRGPEAVDVAEDAPPPVVDPEVLLPAPDVEAVRRVWDRGHARFRPGLRYLGGQPGVTETLLAGLRAGATWRRELLLLELAAGKTAPPKVELKTWARDQRRQLGAGQAMRHPLVQNKTPFVFESLFLVDEKLRPLLVAVVKATLAILGNGACVRAEEQVPLNPDGELGGEEPKSSSYRYEPEVAFFKPATDIVLHGHAYASRRDTREMVVGLRIGQLTKEALVVGDRLWLKVMGVVSMSGAAPFEKIPLRYERAFGGWDRDHADPRKHACEPRTPVGRGFRAAGGFVEGIRLPNIEDPRARIKGFGDRPAPVGFGSTSPNWQPRAALAGTYDEAWQKSRSPLLPKEFDRRYLSAASTGLVAPGYRRGDEQIATLGGCAEGRLGFQLPGLPPPEVQATLANGPAQPMPMRLDTVILEPDERRVMLFWRGNLVLRTGPHDVREVVAVA